ncbi:MAG: hypothetical protein JNJ76_01100 [Candidatus Competibacter sp.]|nr:hypothetical protein [Candidatus Competibacter sp.]
MSNELTTTERELIETLPGPPELAEVRASNVWIVEWLPADETPTGRLLHDWMKDRRQGWSVYFSCGSKNDVITAIKKATYWAQRSELRPVLHLESHGNDVGLAGPNGSGGTDPLAWDELTELLQELNLATRCNLVVVVAACTGFAGIQALRCGPRAPAVALVGPGAPIMPTNLLSGTKEFYRRWLDEKPKLAGIAESASREAGTVIFEWEPFAILAYDALIECLVKSMRPAEQVKCMDRIRQRMLTDTDLPEAEVEARSAVMPPLPPWQELQQVWDMMFMIDLDPTNRARFGLDMRTIVDRITAGRIQ